MDFYIVLVDHIDYKSEDLSYQLKVKDDDLMTFFSKNILGPEILNINFQNWFGAFNKERIEEGNYFLARDSSVVGPFKNNEEIESFAQSKQKLLHLFFGMSQGFSLSLWFIKDNSVNIPFSLTHNIQIGAGLPLTKNVMISNSKGEYETVVFSKEDFDKAKEWLDYISDFYIQDDTGDREYGEYNNLNLDINHNTNSFRRALTYVEQARNTSFLPAKIAFYISVLETLFVVTDSNTYKTPERTAIFLEGTKEERTNNFKIVKDSYDVRSSFVHGSDIYKKHNKKLNLISSDLDEIVRKVLIKFFTEYQHLNYIGDDYKKVNQYFIDLVLGGS